MRIRFAIAAAIAVGLFLIPAAHVRAAQHGYTQIAEIHVGGAASFDYLEVDSAAHRLYLTHSTEVVVIDTASNTVVGRIAAGPRVHGIVITPGDRGFITNGGENTVSIVDLKTLQTITKVPTGGDNPDAILYEPTHNEVYVFNHTGHSATVIDAASGEVVAEIPLSGVAESGRSDAQLGRVFVNIEDADAIDVIDMATHTVVDHWSVAPAASPTGMAIDPTTHRLFVGGGPAQVMIDATNGKVVASVDICRGTDATWLDRDTGMSFSSCSDGHITVVRADSPDAMTVVDTIDTIRGARTMALDTVTHRIYVAGQDYEPVDPNAPAPPPPPPGRRGRGGPPAIPDSFHVLVFGMQ